MRKSMFSPTQIVQVVRWVEGGLVAGKSAGGSLSPQPESSLEED